MPKLFEISVVLVVIGVGAGILGSLVGVGGGIIMSPTLSFLGLAPAQLASTSLIAVSSTSYFLSYCLCKITENKI